MTNLVRVYRSGVVEAPAERRCEALIYAQADLFRPSGQVGRTRGIFASPTLPGVIRWVRGNSFTSSADYRVRELTVDADCVRIYSVRAWERASSGLATETSLGDYWSTGMTLTEWLRRAERDPEEYEPGDWELLLAPEQIIRFRPVSTKRVAAAGKDEYQREELGRMLKRCR